MWVVYSFFNNRYEITNCYTEELAYQPFLGERIVSVRYFG